MTSKIEILFEDSYLLIVNKPVNLPVHVTVDPSRPHLQGVIEKQIGQKVVLFHRLDVDTTGVIVIGKDPSVNAAMTSLFHDRKIEKTYWALVEGKWNSKDKKMESFIRKAPGGKWISQPKGKNSEKALTHFKLLEVFENHCWVEAKPFTGRTHQIRLHCRDLRHPILGDRLYGKANPQGIPIALHARMLKFIHPIHSHEIKVEARTPEHWKYLNDAF